MRNGLLIAIVAALIGSTGVARAQDRPIAFHLGGGPAIPTSGSMTSAWKTGLGVGGSVLIPMNPMVDIALTAEYSRFSYSDDSWIGRLLEDLSSVDGGTLQVFSASAGFFTSTGGESTVSSFAHAAAGVLFSNFEEVVFTTISDTEVLAGYKDTNLFLNVGAGFAFRPNERAPAVSIGIVYANGLGDGQNLGYVVPRIGILLGR